MLPNYDKDAAQGPEAFDNPWLFCREGGGKSSTIVLESIMHTSPHLSTNHSKPKTGPWVSMALGL